MDARWTKKGSKNYYGYKNHIAADRETKFIVDCCVTPASTHDSQMLFEVLSEDPAGDRQVSAQATKSVDYEHQAPDLFYVHVVKLLSFAPPLRPLYRSSCISRNN